MLPMKVMYPVRVMSRDKTVVFMLSLEGKALHIIDAAHFREGWELEQLYFSGYSWDYPIIMTAVEALLRNELVESILVMDNGYIVLTLQKDGSDEDISALQDTLTSSPAEDAEFAFRMAMSIDELLAD